jgi:hypothetical protein
MSHQIIRVLQFSKQSLRTANDFFPQATFGSRKGKWLRPEQITVCQHTKGTSALPSFRYDKFYGTGTWFTNLATYIFMKNTTNFCIYWIEMNKFLQTHPTITKAQHVSTLNWVLFRCLFYYWTVTTKTQSKKLNKIWLNSISTPNSLTSKKS